MAGRLSEPLTAATKRGTILGGRLDCYVATGGLAIVMQGRAATIPERQLVDEVLFHCKQVRIQTDKGFAIAATTDDFIDNLVDYCGFANSNPELVAIGRAWLREFTRIGSAPLSTAALPPETGER